MQYGAVLEAEFLSRPNRFVAWCRLDGETVLAHVKNTGRCRELLYPGARVLLQRSPGEQRRTTYTLLSVWKGDRLVNIDSQAPNALFREARAAGTLDLPGRLRSEVRFGGSRFDFLLEPADGPPRFIEVKGVTLEEKGVALFPDAPTDRGTRHLRELVRALDAGYGALVVFVVQMEGVVVFRPNDRMDPAFGAALREAAARGVGVLALACRVEPGDLRIQSPVPVDLGVNPGTKSGLAQPEREG